MVLELADGSWLVETKAVCGLLHGRHHRRRTANQQLHVGRWRWQMSLKRNIISNAHSSKNKRNHGFRPHLDHISSDETNTAGPALWRVVENVVDPEALVLRGQVVQLLLAQDILRVDVCEDEIDLGPVPGGAAADDGLCDLQHGSDASAAGDHAETLDQVGLVGHGALGAPDLELVANLHLGQVLADVAGGVALDEQVEVAGGRVIGDWGVGAQNLLWGGDAGLGVGDWEGCGEGDVLAGWQAEDGCWAGQLEAVDGRVVREDCLLGQGELLEGGWVEDFLHFCVDG